MSILADVSLLFHEPEQALTAKQDVHIVYVEESYRGIYQKARKVGLELLLEAEHLQIAGAEEGGISINHYWPPLKHNQLRRECPNLFGREDGLGGVSEPEFNPKGFCIVVDNSVDTGQTLWMVREYLLRKGYKEQQIYVAASVWVNGRPQLSRPFEFNPLKSFGQLLLQAQQMLESDMAQFLQSSQPSLPELISAYCKVV